ncbi:LysR family transcriptional regulator [uncultured Nocardioides sp.]|uniref:LysR family transcriptional regulator n=1 Tax=uncultured Nocardioides sp. TaxID=198441 RepID=UPI0026215BA6|nr:LysR family transcriptional regulator [uncultured Nocardioides sp.]
MDLLLHLRAFREVVDQRSFTRAAAELGVPQPVVSRRVAALEKHLGGRLLVRDPRGVTPTDRGRAVLPHARDLEVRADHLLGVARAVGAGVTLAVPGGASARALAPVRDAAREAGLDLELRVADPDDRAAAVARAAGGLALVPCTPDEADLVGPLGAATRDERAGRLHLDTLRASRGDTGRPRRLHLGAEDDRPWVRDVVRRTAGRAGLSPGQVVVGSPALSAVTDVLAHDDVWLATPVEAAAHDLAWRPVADLPVQRSYRLAVGRGGVAAAGPAVRARLLAALGPALGLDAAGAP